MTEDHYEQVRSIAGPVSRETFADLKIFEAEFRRWSAAINLAAPSTLPGLWERHVLDSAQVVPLAGETSSWLDIGSGGGFPGAVIAILLKDRPGARVSLVESNRKKAAFLQTILSRLNTQARVYPIRIEDAVGVVPQPDTITARALAALPELLAMTRPWTALGARGLFHKGRDYRTEVANSTHDWSFDLVEHRSAIDAESVILEISRVSANGRPNDRGR